MSDTKLLPCPFCGGEAELRVSNDGYAVVGCKNDDCQGYACCYKYNSKKEAIQKWNTRKPIERIIERLEENVLGGVMSPPFILKDKAIEICEEEGGIE